MARALVLLVFVGASWTGEAVAQNAAPPTSGETAIPAEALSYDEYRLRELEYVAKRSRTALIGTSAVTAVGVALVVPAAVKECVRVASSSSFDDLRCSSTGKALLGAGVPLLIAGATGVLVTAVLFGVRKGKIKGIEDRLAYERHRAVYWDPERAAFAF